jgi:hypothetical protein
VFYPLTAFSSAYIGIEGVKVRFPQTDVLLGFPFIVEIDVLCGTQTSLHIDALTYPTMVRLCISVVHANDGFSEVAPLSSLFQSKPVAHFRMKHTSGCKIHEVTSSSQSTTSSGSVTFSGAAATPCTQFSVGWDNYDLSQLKLYGPFQASDFLRTYNFTWDICRPLAGSCPCTSGVSNNCAQPGVAAVCQQWTSGGARFSCCVGKAADFTLGELIEAGGSSFTFSLCSCVWATRGLINFFLVMLIGNRGCWCHSYFRRW